MIIVSSQGDKDGEELGWVRMELHSCSAELIVVCDHDAESHTDQTCSCPEPGAQRRTCT